MRAVTIEPGTQDSDRLDDVPDPAPARGQVLDEVLAVGIDGTDDELVAGADGQAPAGEERLIIGHESLGRVVRPAGELVEGQLVTAVVRRPDPVPCLNCAAGEWDMCLNGRYTERGIKARHGFLSEHHVEAPGYLVPVPDRLGRYGVLVEPTLIAEKALDQVDRIQQRLVVGSVNANRRHFAAAVDHLTAIQGRWPGWLEAFWARTVPLENYRDAFDPTSDDIKVVVQLQELSP